MMPRPSEDDLKFLSQMYKARRELRLAEEERRLVLYEPINNQIAIAKQKLHKEFYDRRVLIAQEIRRIKNRFRMHVDYGILRESIQKRNEIT